LGSPNCIQTVGCFLQCVQGGAQPFACFFQCGNDPQALQTLGCLGINCAGDCL
jgi:hypothetical protein